MILTAKAPSWKLVLLSFIFAQTFLFGKAVKFKAAFYIAFEIAYS